MLIGMWISHISTVHTISAYLKELSLYKWNSFQVFEEICTVFFAYFTIRKIDLLQIITIKEAY